MIAGVPSGPPGLAIAFCVALRGRFETHSMSRVSKISQPAKLKLPPKNPSCGKEKPQAVYRLGAWGVCCLNLGSLGRAAGCRGMGSRPVGLIKQKIYRAFDSCNAVSRGSVNSLRPAYPIHESPLRLNKRLSPSPIPLATKPWDNLPGGRPSFFQVAPKIDFPSPPGIPHPRRCEAPPGPPGGAFFLCSTS